jgi:hypothetical protein
MGRFGLARIFITLAEAGFGRFARLFCGGLYLTLNRKSLKF